MKSLGGRFAQFLSRKQDSGTLVSQIQALSTLLTDSNPQALASWKRTHARSVDSSLIGALRAVAVRLLASDAVGDTEQLFRLWLVVREVAPIATQTTDTDLALEAIDIERAIEEDGVGPVAASATTAAAIRTRVYNYRGCCLAERGDYQAAVTHFEVAIGFDPRFAPAYCNRARACLELDQPDRALADCQTVQSFDAEYPPGRETLQLVEAIRHRKNHEGKAATVIAAELGLIPVLRRYDKPAKPALNPMALRLMQESRQPLAAKVDQLSRILDATGREEAHSSTPTQSGKSLPDVIERFGIPGIAGKSDLDLIVSSADYRSRFRNAHEEALQMLAAVPASTHELQAPRMIVGAEVLERRESFSVALAQFKQAFDQLNAAGDREWLFRCAMGIARCGIALATPREARDPLGSALRSAIAASDQSTEGQLRRKLGAVAEACGRPHEAATWYRGSLPLARQDEDWAGELSDLSRLSALATTTQDERRPESYEVESAALRRELRELAHVGPSAVPRADVVAGARATLTPLQPFQIADPNRDARDAEHYYRTANDLRRNQGRPTDAIPAYFPALARYIALNNPEGQTACLNGLAQAYRALAEEAIRAELERIAPSNREGTAPSGQARSDETWSGLGFIRSLASVVARGQAKPWIDFAVACHLMALEVQKAIGSLSGQANQISNLALIEGLLGNADTAVRYQAWALRAHRKDLRLDAARIDLTNLIELYRRLGDQAEEGRCRQQLDELSHAAVS